MSSIFQTSKKTIKLNFIANYMGCSEIIETISENWYEHRKKLIIINKLIKK